MAQSLARGRGRDAPATSPLHLAVIGGGWAGLAAAIEASKLGHHVTLYEMASQLGGRARSLPHPDPDSRLDNGQHILIGAYTATLTLMQELGVAPQAHLLRLPLSLVDPSGNGLRMPPGHPLPAFARAVLALRDWPLRQRANVLLHATVWGARGFRCARHLSVASLTQGLGERVRHELIDPLCVAALNTPADEASAAVFLRVLRDALFAGPGASDLLLPRRPLAALLPDPGRRWLQQRGATLHMGRRVESLRRHDRGWVADGVLYDRVVLACSAAEAARLARPLSPKWADTAAALRHEPIVTVYLESAGAWLAAPMTTLAVDAPQREPAQFAFDHGATHQHPGRFAFVVSGAADWVARGTHAIEEAVRAQARAALRPPSGQPQGPIKLLRTVTEKRATFRCTPGLQRPPMAIAPGLAAAGDHVDGPYPATLEGAVRSGVSAARSVLAHWPPGPERQLAA